MALSAFGWHGRLSDSHPPDPYSSPKAIVVADQDVIASEWTLLEHDVRTGAEGSVGWRLIRDPQRDPSTAFRGAFHDHARMGREVVQSGVAVAASRGDEYHEGESQDQERNAESEDRAKRCILRSFHDRRHRVVIGERRRADADHPKRSPGQGSPNPWSLPGFVDHPEPQELLT